MRWRHHCEARVRHSPDTVLDDHSLNIYGYRNQCRPSLAQEVASCEIAWIFHPATVTWLQQTTADQVKARAVTCGNENLPRRTGYSPGNGKISGKCSPQ